MSPHTYAMAYEFRSDEGDYTPTDGERAMIEDAICGYLAEAALSAPAPSIDAEAVFAKLTRYEPVSAFSEGAMSEAPEGDWLNYDQVWHVIAALAPDPAARMEAEREEG